jgi:hypothetical protein
MDDGFQTTASSSQEVNQVRIIPCVPKRHYEETICF